MRKLERRSNDITPLWATFFICKFQLPIFFIHRPIHSPEPCRYEFQVIPPALSIIYTSHQSRQLLWCGTFVCYIDMKFAGSFSAVSMFCIREFKWSQQPHRELNHIQHMQQTALATDNDELEIMISKYCQCMIINFFSAACIKTMHEYKNFTRQPKYANKNQRPWNEVAWQLWTVCSWSFIAVLTW